MDCKEEISDTDSGIILQCGLDSPSSPMKDVSAQTQAARLRQQALQDRLEECLSDLKDLCIREAELTGHLSSDYPLLPGETPPTVRRRIGTAFRLDEESILQGGEHPELGPLEAELALQLQIYEAARRLCHEEHLSRAVKRSRLQQCRVARRKVKELEEAVSQLQFRLGRGSPRPPGPDGLPDLGTSDNTSLSDSALQDEEDVQSQGSDGSLEASPGPDPLPPAPGTPPRPLHVPPYPPLPVLEEQTPEYSPSLDYDRPPIQNSPWAESSLDEPYQKPKKKSRSACNSHTSSPMVTPTVTPMSTPTSTPVDSPFGSSAHPLHFSPIKSLELHHAQSHSAPCTPELQLRRQQSQSFRLPNRELPHESAEPRGRTRLARRRVAGFGEAPGEHAPLQVGLRTTLYPSSSEDSCSEHSAPSYASSCCSDFPAELTNPRLPHYGYPNDGPHSGPLPYDGPHSRALPYDGPHSRALPYDGPHSKALSYDGHHSGALPYNGPHSRALSYDGPHSGALSYDGPHSRTLPYDGPHRRALPYDGPHSRALPYDGPHSRALPYDGPHSGALPYDGPHGRALPYDGPHGGALPYDGPHGRALSYDGPHGRALSYDGPHGRALSYDGPHGGALPYDGPHGGAVSYDGPHGEPLTYTGTFYKNPMPQSSPSFYGGYIKDDRGYPPEMDLGRLYLGPPGPPGRYEHWYEEAPRRPMLRALPPQVRLGRAPSLREPPAHPQGRAHPRDLVSEGPKSGQQGAPPPRPRSLDRQGVVRVRGAQERESPLAQSPRQQLQQPQQRQPQQQPPHSYQEQVPHRVILQRGPDGAPVQWYTQEDSEIATQV